MLMTRRILSTATTVLATAAAALLLPQTAQAAEEITGPHYRVYTNEYGTPYISGGGKADFWPNGDVVQICDNAADGASAYLSVYDETSHDWRYALTASGNGVCQTARGSDGGVRDLAEGHCIKITVQLYYKGPVLPGSEKVVYWRNNNTSGGSC
ncbi:hypothetical protein ACWCXX_41495 [Streptomyces sp. NPDC001732]